MSSSIVTLLSVVRTMSGQEMEEMKRKLEEMERRGRRWRGSRRWRVRSWRRGRKEREREGEGEDGDGEEGRWKWRGSVGIEEMERKIRI